MIVRSFLMGAFSAIFLLVGLFPAASSAQPAITGVVQQVLPKASLVKYPEVAVAGRTVGVSGSADKRTAKTWVKTVDQTTFSDPAELGAANGNQDYTNAAISGRSDGTLSYAWIENDNNSPIKVRQRYGNGTFSGEVTALGGGKFRVYVDVASNNAGTTVIAWSESKRFRYAYSTNGNINQWNGFNAVLDEDSQNRPILAVGPNNTIGIVVGTGGGDIRYGLWNGSGFTIEKVTNDGAGPFDADPTLTYLPNGTPVVAWRKVEGGYWYSERQSNGTWPSSKLSDDTVVTQAAIASDEAGNLTFAWLREGEPARLRVAYATAKPNQVFAGPIDVAVGDFRPNPLLATTVTDKTQINLVNERFGGSGLVAEYWLLTAQGAGSMGAQPVVTSSYTSKSVPIVRGTGGVNVSFSNVSGSPSQIRYRWGAAPDDTTTDSNGWVTYSSPMSVTVPSNINTSDCKAETLYTQVRNGSTFESSAKSVSMIVDSKVTGSVRAVNPYIGDKLPVFTNPQDVGALPQDLISNGGASDGDPGYTRDPLFYLEAVGNTDCSGLQRIRYGPSLDGLNTGFGVVDNVFANVLALPNPANLTEGPRTLSVRLSDNIGNTYDVTQTIIVDTTKPVLAEGASFTITSDPNATILEKLSFSNVQVTDAYPGGYWGVWVANSLTQVNDTSTLNWTPVELETKGTSPVLEDWSVLTGLNRSVSSFTGSQTFYIYVRFLDGAGNPTDQVVSSQVTLQRVTDVDTHLPLIRR